jgi:hypothetical protein
MTDKRFRVLVIEHNEPKSIIADHDLIPVTFEGVTGFISKSLYDVLLTKENELRDILGIWISEPTKDDK